MARPQHADEGRPAPSLPGGIDWARLGNNVSGPLLTMAVAIILDLLTRAGVHTPAPFPILLLTVAIAAMRGGAGPGIVSALIALTYGYHFLSDDGQGRLFTPENFRELVALGVVAPALVTLIVLGRRWYAARVGTDEDARRRSAEDARAAVLVEAGALLSGRGALDDEGALQRVVRLIVPSLADWATVHLVEDDGRIHYVAGAHRDPGRELLVQGFAQQPPRPLSRAVHRPHDARPGATVVQGAADAVSAIAADDDHSRRVDALDPASVITVPLIARDRPVGLLLLARTGDSQPYGTDDLRVADQLGSWASLAVDQARLAAHARDADHRARLLFEGNPQPMWVFDVATLAFLAVNDAAVRVYGYDRDEFLHMTVMDFRPDEDPAIWLHPGERLIGKRGEVAVTRHQKKDGTVVDVEIVSHEVMWGQTKARLVMVSDISDRARTQAALQQSEEQLRQAQKMDAVGRLASGIAHDFNNLLTAIQGYSEMLLRDAPPEDPHRSDLEEIRRAADRGALLTRQLLAFARRQLRRPKPVDVNRIITGMETLLQRLVGADVQLATVLEPDVGRVLGDPAHVEQIVMNLVLNARDAMPRGGMLTIETSQRYIGPSPRHRQLRPGRHVVLTVSDTGAGLEEEAGEEQLFEPFYSAKSPRGTGLGLSIVYGIVRQSGGAVRVSSEPGQGTTVRIYLPLIDEAADADTGELPAVRGGLETVLLVEDEEAVRELLKKVLARQGYTVLEARHGRDALLVSERHKGPIHLVLTDVVMPEMGGRELVTQLRASRPETRVLYISGYTNDEVVRRGIAESDGMFIQKPFSSDDLVRRVRELLDNPAPAAATA
jgi:hypothetical protein